jgi:hypothetical protein
VKLISVDSPFFREKIGDLIRAELLTTLTVSDKIDPVCYFIELNWKELSGRVLIIHC